MATLETWPCSACAARITGLSEYVKVKGTRFHLECYLRPLLASARIEGGNALLLAQRHEAEREAEHQAAARRAAEDIREKNRVEAAKASWARLPRCRRCGTTMSASRIDGYTSNYPSGTIADACLNCVNEEARLRRSATSQAPAISTGAAMLAAPSIAPGLGTTQAPKPEEKSHDRFALIELE